MDPFRGPYRGSPLRDPCWRAFTTEVAAHWEEVLMGPFRGGTHTVNNLSYFTQLERNSIFKNTGFLPRKKTEGSFSGP